MNDDVIKQSTEGYPPEEDINNRLLSLLEG